MSSGVEELKKGWVCNTCVAQEDVSNTRLMGVFELINHGTGDHVLVGEELDNYIRFATWVDRGEEMKASQEGGHKTARALPKLGTFNDLGIFAMMAKGRKDREAPKVVTSHGSHKDRITSRGKTYKNTKKVSKKKTPKMCSLFKNGLIATSEETLIDGEAKSEDE